MRYLLTTDPGIEDIAAAEAEECVPGARATVDPYGEPGHVLAECAAAEPLLALTTIQHVVEVLGEAEVASLEDARAAVRATEFAAMESARSFRVTSAAAAGHGFDRRALQGAAGAVLQQRHGTAVDLEQPEVVVRVDLYGSRLVLGIQRTRDSLGKRLQRGKALRTSIRPTTAAAMLRLAGAHRGPGRLLDPLCGAGTIPVEAKRINPELDVYAADWDGPTAEVARQTAANHGVAIDVRVADARALRRAYDAPFDTVVTDPPYGARLGRKPGIGTLYRAVMPSLESVLAADGRIVIAVLKYKTLLWALENTGLEVLAERTVGAGDLRPRVVVLARR